MSYNGHVHLFVSICNTLKNYECISKFLMGQKTNKQTNKMQEMVTLYIIIKSNSDYNGQKLRWTLTLDLSRIKGQAAHSTVLIGGKQ